MKSWLVPSLLLMLSLSGCETTVQKVELPPCPTSGPEVAADFALGLPRDRTHAWQWLGRVMLYCEAIDVLRAR